MFNLIITIISIALVVATAAASIYYGGQAFNQGQAKAGVATLANIANQVAAAEQIYRIDHGGSFGGVTDLVAGHYLTSDLQTIPTAAGTDAPAYASQDNGNVVVIGIQPTVCALVNENAGHPGIESTLPYSDLTPGEAYLQANNIREACLYVNTGDTQPWLTYFNVTSAVATSNPTAYH